MVVMVESDGRQCLSSVWSLRVLPYAAECVR